MKARELVGGDSWRRWVLGILLLLLCDHLGAIELHSIGAGDRPDIHEVVALVAGLGAALSAFRRGD
jgi:hypothetical protein